MKSIQPKKFSEYPLYIFSYWILIWGLVLIYETLGIILNLTETKEFVIKTSESGVTYYVPLGNALIEIFIQTGILTGIITILVGYSWFIYKWSRKKK